MVFHWSLNDSKSPQISSTLLSIMADLSHVIVWMLSTRPLIYQSTSPFNNPWVTVPRTPICSIFFFNLLATSDVLLPFFHFLSILLCGQPEQQNPQFYKFVFFVYSKFWSSGRDLVIRLFDKILLEFMRLILQDRFCVVHIRFVRIVHFKFIVQFL